MEGTNTSLKEKQWIIVLVPVTFFARRLFLAFTLVFWMDFFWGQIAIQLLTSKLIVILVGWYRPFDTAFANNMELFNELVSLGSLYLMMSFSDAVGDPKTRSYYGYAFIGLMGVYVAVHIGFLVYDLVLQVRQACRRKYYEWYNRRAH